ncbi:hypothetical protein [Nitratidesulfovibrio sp.]|uniref:hypothetical protein n=1 Tax=Nitratidesulfovibrio sp. TaxID=2802297 RepID=UPI003342B76B
MVAQEVYRGTDAPEASGGNFHQPGLATALPLVRGVIRKGDEALFGKLEGIQPGGLFLDPAEGMGDDDGWVLLACVEARRLEQVANYLRPQVSVRKRDASIPMLPLEYPTTIGAVGVG